jgi:hypothetical protein
VAGSSMTGEFAFAGSSADCASGAGLGLQSHLLVECRRHGGTFSTSWCESLSMYSMLRRLVALRIAMSSSHAQVRRQDVRAGL